MTDLERYKEFINRTEKPILMVTTKSIFVLPKSTTANVNRNNFGAYLQIDKYVKVELSKIGVGYNNIEVSKKPVIIDVKNIKYCDVIKKELVRFINE